MRGSRGGPIELTVARRPFRPPGTLAGRLAIAVAGRRTCAVRAALPSNLRSRGGPFGRQGVRPLGLRSPGGPSNLRGSRGGPSNLRSRGGPFGRQGRSPAGLRSRWRAVELTRLARRPIELTVARRSFRPPGALAGRLAIAGGPSNLRGSRGGPSNLRSRGGPFGRQGLRRPACDRWAGRRTSRSRGGPSNLRSRSGGLPARTSMRIAMRFLPRRLRARRLSTVEPFLAPVGVARLLGVLVLLARVAVLAAGPPVAGARRSSRGGLARRGVGLAASLPPASPTACRARTTHLRVGMLFLEALERRQQLFALGGAKRRRQAAGEDRPVGESVAASAIGLQLRSSVFSTSVVRLMRSNPRPCCGCRACARARAGSGRARSTTDSPAGRGPRRESRRTASPSAAAPPASRAAGRATSISSGRALSVTARSTAFSSWRTLPGHGIRHQRAHRALRDLHRGVRRRTSRGSA